LGVLTSPMETACRVGTTFAPSAETARFRPAIEKFEWAEGIEQRIEIALLERVIRYKGVQMILSNYGNLPCELPASGSSLPRWPRESLRCCVRRCHTELEERIERVSARNEDRRARYRQRIE